MYNYGSLIDVPIVDESITTTPTADQAASEDRINNEKIILSSQNVKDILSQLSQINQKLGNIERLLLVSSSSKHQGAVCI